MALFYDLRDKLAVRSEVDKMQSRPLTSTDMDAYSRVLDVESESDAARHMVKSAPWYAPVTGTVLGGLLGVGLGGYGALLASDKRNLKRNLLKGIAIGGITGGLAGGIGGHLMHRQAVEHPEMYEHPVYWGPIAGKYAPGKMAAYTGYSPYLTDKKAYTLIELGLAAGLTGGAFLGGRAIRSHYKRKAEEEKRAREIAFNRKAALTAGIAGGAMLGGYALHRAYGNGSAKTASIYDGSSLYLDKKALGLGEMRMNVLGEASAARQAAEAARVQPAPTVADTVKATAEKAYTRKKASPAVNPKFFKRMLSTRGGKAALIGGAGLAALGLGGAGYAGYRKYSKPEVPWYLTQGGTAGIGALAGGLMGAGAGYGAAGRPGAGAGGMLGALGGAAAGYYGNDIIRGYTGY